MCAARSNVGQVMEESADLGLGLLSSQGWHRAGFVIPLCGGQGWVCYPAAGEGLGLLSRCWWFGFDRECVCVWLRQGRVCYPVVRAGLGLLSRCRNKAGCVAPLLENSVLLVSERLRSSWVHYPRRCYVEDNFAKLWACMHC